MGKKLKLVCPHCDHKIDVTDLAKLIDAAAERVLNKPIKPFMVRDIAPAVESFDTTKPQGNALFTDQAGWEDIRKKASDRAVVSPLGTLHAIPAEEQGK